MQLDRGYVIIDPDWWRSMIKARSNTRYGIICHFDLLSKQYGYKYVSSIYFVDDNF